MCRLKVLCMAANPEQTTKLKLDEEIRTIPPMVRASAYRDSLDLFSIGAVQPDDWLQYLNHHKPHMVHLVLK